MSSFRLLSALPAAALLLLCACATPSAAANSLTFTQYPDEGCDVGSEFGSIKVAVADGSCQPMTSTGGSAELVLGFTGAAYAKAYCGPTSTVKATLMIFSDATCSNSSMIGVRKQMSKTGNTPSQYASCFDMSVLTCSGFSTNVAAPSTPPVGYAKSSKCLYGACDQTGNRCSDTYLRPNVCIPRLDRAFPTTRSSMILCDGGDNYKELAFLDGVCSQSALVTAGQQPNAICKTDKTQTCPMTTVPLPSPVPIFPTASTAGYAVQTSQCNDNTCSTGCVLTAMKLSTCVGQAIPGGTNSVAMYCVNATAASNPAAFSQKAGSSAIVGVIYPDDKCANAQIFGSVLARDPAGSCMSQDGVVGCAAPSTDLPYFSGAYTSWSESTTCNTSTPATTMLINANSCASIPGTTSFYLSCPGTTAGPYMNIYDNDACSGTPFAAPSSPDKACAPLVIAGQATTSSVDIQCEMMFATTAAPPAALTAAASATSAASVLAIAFAALVAMMTC